MPILFLTGLSGVGKSSVLSELKNRGYKTTDLDYGYITFQHNERLFDEMKVNRLLENHKASHLILAGTESNQGQFYSSFDVVVLLTADLDTMLDRIKARESNRYGKTKEERAEIIESYYAVLPLLKQRAQVIIDTTDISVEEVCDQLESLL